MGPSPVWAMICRKIGFENLISENENQGGKSIQTQKELWFMAQTGEETKRGDSPLSGKTQVALFSPKTKKPTRRSVGGEFSKWCRWGDLGLTFLRSPKMRIFQLPQDGVVHHLENFSERFVKIRITSKSGLYIAKTLSKGFELATSTCGLKWTTMAGPRQTCTTAPPPVANRNRTDAPYNYSGNTPFFKRSLSECAQVSGRYPDDRLLPCIPDGSLHLRNRSAPTALSCWSVASATPTHVCHL